MTRTLPPEFVSSPPTNWLFVPPETDLTTPTGRPAGGVAAVPGEHVIRQAELGVELWVSEVQLPRTVGRDLELEPERAQWVAPRCSCLGSIRRPSRSRLAESWRCRS